MRSIFHILVIPSWYPTEQNPINGIFFKEQSEALAKYGFKVSVIYAETQEGLKKITINKFKKNHFQIEIKNINNVLTYRFLGWSFPPKISRLKISFWINRMLNLADKYIQENGKPDIIHAHCALWGGYVAYLISRKYGIPYILTEHFTGYARNLVKPWEKVKAKCVIQGSSFNLAVSKSFADLLDHIFNLDKNSFGVMPNIVDIEYFNLPDCNRVTKPFIFLNVSFLTPKKGIDILIKAFNMAFKDNENVLLKIGGDGEQRQELEQLVNELGINNKVIFLGLLDRQAVKNAMHNANALVISSYYETFGVVAIEAMSTGLPVIATKCGGPEDIITSDKLGILINRGDINEMANALKYMYNNYKSYNQELIRKHTIENYNDQVIVKKLEKIYNKVLLNSKKL